MWTPTSPAPADFPRHVLATLGPYAFAVHTGGVFRWDSRNDRWHDMPWPAGGHAVAACAWRDKLYAGTDEQRTGVIREIDPDTLAVSRLPSDPLVCDEAMCAGTDGLWVVGSKGVRLWTGRAWRALGELPRWRTEHVAFERAGRLWVCGGRSDEQGAAVADVRLPDVEAGLHGGSGNVLVEDSGRWEQVRLAPPGVAVRAVVPRDAGPFLLAGRWGGADAFGTVIASYQLGPGGAPTDAARFPWPLSLRVRDAVAPMATGILAIGRQVVLGNEARGGWNTRPTVALRWTPGRDVWEPEALPTDRHVQCAALADGRVVLTAEATREMWLGS